MAQQANLQVASRTVTGKGAARSLRREGKVPGVIYGHGREAESVTVDTATLKKMLVGISAATTIVDVTVDGRAPVKALIREIQRDSLRPADIIHLDLYEVRSDEEITLQVPVRLIGIPDGVRNFGGVLDHVLRELEIEVLPADIPEHVDLDVTALAIGHSLFVRDLQVPKAKVLNDPDTPICTVVAPRAEEAPGGGRRRGGCAGRAGAHPEAEGRGRGRDRREGLSPARDRWAGQPRPGVRRNPAQRRVSIGRPPGGPLASWDRSAAASARGRPRERGTAAPCA